MVVRGCEKRIYHVKNTESELFDEAYFILKVGEKRGTAGPRELEREALRLVNGTQRGGSSTKREAKRICFRSFLLGNIFSCAVIAVICLILWAVL